VPRQRHLAAGVSPLADVFFDQGGEAIDLIGADAVGGEVGGLQRTGGLCEAPEMG
jgi:hypothetical protein